MAPASTLELMNAKPQNSSILTLAIRTTTEQKLMETWRTLDVGVGQLQFMAT
jgi:hypothetical protein